MTPWIDQPEEVVELTRSLIRVDSTNGNETEVAEVLADYLSPAGVEVELVARDPSRANLVARIPGREPSAHRWPWWATSTSYQPTRATGPIRPSPPRSTTPVTSSAEVRWI